MDKNEALKLALEALERSVATCFYKYAHDQVMSEPNHFINQTITAIKEALAQSESESESDDLTAAYLSGFHDGKNKDAPQREWVGLTDEEYKNIRYGSDESGERYVSYTSYDEGGYEPEIEIYVDDFAKAIEAKLREKNGG